MKPNPEPTPAIPAPSPAATPKATAGKEAKAISNQDEILALAKKDPKVLRLLHGSHFSGNVLRTAYEQFTGKNVISETAQDFGEDVIKQMEARDPLESMLIDQMLWTHVRIGKLSNIAIQQTGIKQVQVVNEAADRALNTFRRLMLALREYRDPKPAPSFTAIKQQNIAMMNNTQGQESQKKTVTNEKETTDAPAPPKSLPADTGTVSLPADFHPSRPAVAVGNRAEDTGRQSPQQQERP